MKFLNRKVIFVPSICLAFGLAAFLCYLPGLGGPFLLDDFSNLVRLERIDGSVNGFLLSIFENDGRILNRPISYASFILNSSGWPEAPFEFKVFNLSLHLTVGGLLCYFLY